MSLQDINDAAAAQNALTAEVNGFMETVDADIAAKQAAYAALANNLRGVVGSEMHQNVNWTPNAPADDPENLVFKTWSGLVDFINARPSKSYTRIFLANAGGQYLVDRDLMLGGGRQLEIAGSFSSVPTLTIAAVADGAAARFYGIRIGLACALLISVVNFRFGVLPNPGSGISSSAAFIRQDGSSTIALSNTDASCEEAGRVVFVPQYSGICQLNNESCVFDGNIIGLGGQPAAIALYSVRGAGLLNGAQLYDQTVFTVGQNMLFS